MNDELCSSKGEAYSARLVIPKKLRSILGKNEFKKSLGTSYVYVGPPCMAIVPLSKVLTSVVVVVVTLSNLSNIA